MLSLYYPLVLWLFTHQWTNHFILQTLIREFNVMRDHDCHILVSELTCAAMCQRCWISNTLVMDEISLLVSSLITYIFFIFITQVLEIRAWNYSFMPKVAKMYCILLLPFFLCVCMYIMYIQYLICKIWLAVCMYLYVLCSINIVTEWTMCVIWRYSFSWEFVIGAIIPVKYLTAQSLHCKCASVMLISECHFGTLIIRMPQFC